MNKSIYKFLTLLVIIPILAFCPPVYAQEEPTGPKYIIQEGDTLGLIALRFGVTVDALMQANNLTDRNAINLGAELVIPGLEDFNGVMKTEPVVIGQTLDHLALRNQISKKMLARINRITSPLEVYAGSNIILPIEENTSPAAPIGAINPNQSLLELAIVSNSSSWELVFTNQLRGTWDVIPGQVIYQTGKESAGNSISPYIADLNITPLPLSQGTTALISVVTNQPLTLSGHLADYPLNFFQNGENNYVAFQGIHAQQSLGLTSFTISGSIDDQPPVFAFDQMLLVQSGLYGTESLIVDPSYIDPAVTVPEEEQINTIISNVSGTRYWTEKFACLVDPPACIQSWYGTRRTYNEGIYQNFHSGVDYGVCATKNIYAPAPGIVVFAGTLTVRGNTTFIDHGWGVYSGIFHQEEIFVQPGEQVVEGQLLGTIGGTGRVTGPHLHYEIWVNGVQVQPLDWLDEGCQ